MEQKNPLKSRVDFVLVFSADNANPNGDPGDDNRPRTDPYTKRGLITDVCIKRKIRNRVEMIKALADGYDIWVRSGTYLRETLGNAIGLIRKEDDYANLKDDKLKESYERRRICEKFFDIRTFGGVLTADSGSGEEDDETKEDQKPSKAKKNEKAKSKVSQIRGPVSIQYAKSVAPIFAEDDQITRVCQTRPDKNPDPQKRKPIDIGEMGRKKRVPFAVYVAKGSVSVRLAEGEKGTGFSEEDLKVLKEALKTLFVGDESAARPAGSMVVQKLFFFTHKDKDGDEPVHRTLDRVKISLKPEFQDKPMKAQSMAAYSDIEVVNEGLPQSVVVDKVVW